MAIQQVQQPDTMEKGQWAEGVWELHKPTGAMVKHPTSVLVDGAKRLVCEWDDAVAAVPTEQEITDAYNAKVAAKQAEQDNASDARTKLLNNADLLRQAMGGISEARSALDAVVPIDTTNQSTIVNSIAQRQAAIFFLAANTLRAVAVLDKTGDLPDRITDEFV